MTGEKTPRSLGLESFVARERNAIERFVTFAMEQAGLSRDEANRAFVTYRKAKVLKLDRIGGQFTFTHGAFAEADVLRRAAAQE